MDESKTPLETVKSPRERICLDFVNTVDWRGNSCPEDRLQNFQELIRWSQQVDLLSDREAQSLLLQAAEQIEGQRKTREKARTNGHLRKDWKPGERKKED